MGALEEVAADEARRALHSGEFYRRVLDEVDDGVYVLDSDRQIIYWNKGAERITGYPAAEVVGRGCRDNILIHVDSMGNQLCTGACPALTAMRENRVCRSDVYVHHKLGHRVPIHARIVPLKDPREKVVGGIEVFTDDTSSIAARQRMEELERLSLLDTLTSLGNRRHAEVPSTRGCRSSTGTAGGSAFCISTSTISSRSTTLSATMRATTS